MNSRSSVGWKSGRQIIFTTSGYHEKLILGYSNACLGELAKLFVAWLGNPARALAAVMIASAIAIWIAPVSGLLGVLRDPFWRWFGIAFLVSAAWLSTYPISHAWEWAAGKRRERSVARKIVIRLANLTPHEKKVLFRYLDEDSTTANWGRGAGPVEALARDGILLLLTQNHTPDFHPAPYVFAIDDTAWKHLQAHPELVGLVRIP
jgi:hypothetical protein